MITLATLQDEMVEGQRRAAGKMIRKIVIIGLDNYNIVIAEGSDPENPVGKKFFGRLTHLADGLAEYGLDVEYARKQILAFFKEQDDLTWAEIDEKFHVGKRCNDSSGKLQLYVDLQAKDGAETLVETA